MSYRDELEAAHARIARLEGELERARVALEAKPLTPVTPGRRRRWADLAVSVGAGLALMAVDTTIAALRGAGPFEQVLALFTTLVGPSLILALAVLMIVDAHPLTDAEERKKRRWGIAVLAFVLAFEVWKNIVIPI